VSLERKDIKRRRRGRVDRKGTEEGGDRRKIEDKREKRGQQ
jgi:hypothetical protein